MFAPFRRSGISAFIFIIFITSLTGHASTLSDDDEQVLRSGPISASSHLLGIAAAIIPGFGVGQAVQGRWAQSGWIFTLGELGAVAGAFAASPHCLDSGPSKGSCDGMVVLGAVAGALRLWEILNAVIAPTQQNANYDRLKWNRKQDYGMRLFPAPVSDRMAPGMAVAWNF